MRRIVLRDAAVSSVCSLADISLFIPADCSKHLPDPGLDSVFQLRRKPRAGVHCQTLEPEGTKRATSVNVRLPRLQKDLRTGSMSRDIVNFPSELCRRRSGMFTEVACLVPPH